MAEEGRARRGGGRGQGVTLGVSTEDRPGFKERLVAYHFDAAGNLVERVPVEGGRLRLQADAQEAGRGRLFILPAELEGVEPSPAVLTRLGAHEAILRPGGKLVDVIRIPGGVIDLWPLCFCTVKGQVVRASDGRPVCNARVHVCEVDRIPIWIAKLPDPEVLRLRDELLSELRKPAIPPAGPELPFPPKPGPGPDPAPDLRSLFPSTVAPPAPPATGAAGEVARERLAPLDLDRRLASSSPAVLRAALADNWKLLLPYFCWWRWWWGWFRCDELRVLTTDPNGRFQATIPYLCTGDKPDLHFWVEYDLGNGFETVYDPPIACSTYWDYACGTEVTIRVSDPRVPGCNDEPNLPGKQVWVLSVGRTVSIGELYTSGSQEGLVSEPWDASTSEDYAFGGKLEPRVWFSRDSLIGSGVTHYLWSRRLVGTTAWTPLTRQVIRHYTDIASGTIPIDVMGPESGGPNAGRFRIRPTAVPSVNPDDEWVVVDEREDLATAHFETSAPPPSGAACGVADPAAGKYELKLELFDSAGNLVDLDAHGITLRYATSEAPFGTGTVSTIVADDYHRVKTAGGHTVGFRMVLHVDNSLCGAAISPVTGVGVTGPDPDCGIVSMVGPNPTIDISFSAGRPGGLARFALTTRRGTLHDVPEAITSGRVTDASTPAAAGGNFNSVGSCGFTKTNIATSVVLGGCPQAAFAEYLYVYALTQDGYYRLDLDASALAAFMLSEPCDCADGGGHGHGHGG